MKQLIYMETDNFAQIYVMVSVLVSLGTGFYDYKTTSLPFKLSKVRFAFRCS